MKLFRRYKKTITPLLIIFALAIAVTSIAYLAIHFLHFLTKHDAEEVHFLIFVITSLLAIIAYYEFNRSNKLTENEFLLFTSNRWNSKEIIRARQILHEIFVDAYRDEMGKKKSDFSIALSHVSEKILAMSRAKGKDGKKFIYLLNLLDYLEILSYFYYKDDLTLPDIQNTCGNNIVFFHDSFKAFIDQRRSHDKKYYINFIALYNDLKNHEIKNDRVTQEIKN